MLCLLLGEFEDLEGILSANFGDMTSLLFYLFGNASDDDRQSARLVAVEAEFKK